MKAVNLIPADQRRGAGGAAGRAGGAVYVLLGGLAVLVILSVVYAISASQVSDRQSKLNHVSAQADVVRALPNDVTLSAMTGGPPTATAAAPGVPAPAAGGPSVALTGCATTHSEVANVLVSLQRIVGVTGVQLASSQKANGPTGATATTCPGANFTATLVYSAASAASTPTTNPQGVTATTATSPTAGSAR
jgi:hypothetical protein